MIIHCDTCNVDLLETESERLALDTKDLHEFEHQNPEHPVNLYIEQEGQRIRIAGLIASAVTQNRPMRVT
jgi:hypothetical protein